MERSARRLLLRRRGHAAARHRALLAARGPAGVRDRGPRGLSSARDVARRAPKGVRGGASNRCDVEPVAHSRSTVFDDVAYWLTIASVYFLVGVLFFYSGKEKLFDGDAKAPPAIADQF